MMPAMRPRLFVLLVPLALLPGCAGVSTRVDRATADAVPSVTIDTKQRARVAELVDRAIAAVVRRQFVDAEVEAESALSIDPRAARARAVRALVLAQRGSETDPPDLGLVNAAEFDLRIAQQIAPNDLFVGWMYALFLAETGHVSAAADMAEATLRKAEAAPAAERAALFGLAGKYRYELGEERMALPSLQAYVAMRPDDIAARFRLGFTLLRLAQAQQEDGSATLSKVRWQAEAAAEAFGRCAEMAPGDEDVALAISVARLRAAELCEQMAKTKEGDRATNAQAAAEHRDAATRSLLAVVERFPDNAEPHFRLGVLAEQRGESAAAIADYERALARESGHLGSLLNLASLVAASGDRQRARTLLQRAVAEDVRGRRLTDDERKRIQAWLQADEMAH